MNTRVLAAISVAALLMTAAAQAATPLNDEENAMLMAKLSLYEAKCGPVSKNVKGIIEYMGQNVVSNSKFIAATSQLNSLIRESGDTRMFCQIMGESVQKFDQRHPD